MATTGTEIEAGAGTGTTGEGRTIATIGATTVTTTGDDEIAASILEKGSGSSSRLRRLCLPLPLRMQTGVETVIFCPCAAAMANEETTGGEDTKGGATITSNTTSTAEKA